MVEAVGLPVLALNQWPLCMWRNHCSMWMQLDFQGEYLKHKPEFGHTALGLGRLRHYIIGCCGNFQNKNFGYTPKVSAYLPIHPQSESSSVDNETKLVKLAPLLRDKDE